VLTGETGAGKSIVVDALGLVLGHRAHGDVVRQGCSSAEITAEFEIKDLNTASAWLQSNDLAEQGDEVCVIRRVMIKEGRSRAYINGHQVPIAQLQQLGKYLVNIHGQHEHQALLAALPQDAEPVKKYKLKLEIASDLLALEQKQEAWAEAKACLDFFIENYYWQQAVESCDVLYQSEQDDSLLALAHGVWLAVTFPVAPETSVAMLQHIIDETPADSDGAAVAVITAHYIATMRSADDKRDSLCFLTTQLISQVAKRHSQVDDQEMLDFWMEKLELKDPAVFLPRLAKILEVIVQDKWWYDRDKLRRMIPDN